MQRTRLGQVLTSQIGLGTRGFGRPGRSEEACLSAVDLALELGIIHIDTASHYGGGEAHHILARAMKGRRGSFRLAVHIATPGASAGLLTGDRIRGWLEEALRGLTTDYVDILQLHYDDPAADYEEVATTLEELRRRGRLVEYGLSNFSCRELSRWPAWSSPVSVQLPHNLIQRSAVQRLRSAVQARGMKFIAYTPLMAGVLTDQGLSGEHLAPAARLMYQGLDREGREFLARLRAVAQERGLSVAQLAIGWTLLDEDVAVVLVGASDPHHVRQAWDAVRSPKTMKEMLEEVGKPRVPEPVMPMPATVGRVLRVEGREALVEIQFRVQGQEVAIARWLPAGIKEGQKLSWDGLGDRLLGPEP